MTMEITELVYAIYRVATFRDPLAAAPRHPAPGRWGQDPPARGWLPPAACLGLPPVLGVLEQSVDEGRHRRRLSEQYEEPEEKQGQHHGHHPPELSLP